MAKLSIGLPIYNGENYCEQAIKSLQAQDFTDFELIIADNASTDRTGEICRRYEAADSRVRYFRHDENKGAAYNFNFTFEKAGGKYFKWAAHDDVLSSQYLDRCVEHLDRNPDVVLCHTRTESIDAEGNHIEDDNYPLRLESEQPHVRFRDLSIIRHECFLVFGVIRHEVLAQSALIGNYEGSDRVLLSELSMHGKFHEIPEVLFSRRRHKGSGCALPEREDRLAWYDPANRGKFSYHNWRILQENVAAIGRTSNGTWTKIKCLLQTPEYLLVRRGFLVRELIEGLKWSIKSTPTGFKVFMILKRFLKPQPPQ